MRSVLKPTTQACTGSLPQPPPTVSAPREWNIMRLALPLCTIVIFTSLGFAQEHNHTVPHLGVGIKVSSLGAGIETAVPLFWHSHLRTGFNYFIYDRDLADQGVAYRGELNFRSAQATYDWYPFHGAFHLGPTVLFYNGTHVHAKLNVPAGRTFTISQNTYKSDPSNPINGNASMTLAKIAPGFLLGWGNLLTRRHHHFSFPVEFGFIYEGAPNVALTLSGSGCDPKGRGCSTLDSDDTAVKSIRAEQSKLTREVTFLRFYPIVSFGIGYSF